MVTRTFINIPDKIKITWRKSFCDKVVSVKKSKKTDIKWGFYDKIIYISK